MSAIPRALARTLAIASVVLLAACGGGGGGAPADAPAPGDDTDTGNNAPDIPAPGGDPDTGDDTPAHGVRSACQQDFSPKRVDDGEQCMPRYFDFCPSIAGGALSYDQVPPCDGVLIDFISESNVQDSFSGTMEYTVLRPASGTPRAVVTTVHFRQIGRDGATSTATHATLMRMAELVKGRNVMVIVPGAPGGNWPQSSLSDLAADLTSGVLVDQLLSGLLGGLFNGALLDNPLVEQLTALGVPIGAIEDLLVGGGTLGDLAGLIGDLTPTASSVQDYMDYIELSMRDAVGRFGGAGLPHFMSGLSNGAIYALRFACQRPDQVEAVLSVAGALGPVEAIDCVGQSPVGTVQVHGTADLLAPYSGGIVAPVRGGPLAPLPIEGGDLPLVGDVLPSLDSLLQPIPGLFLDVFRANNGCSGGIDLSVIPAGAAGRGELAGDVFIERFRQCNNPGGKQSFMVTVERGGHNWPGYDAPSDADANAFGVISRDFDTTLYGFDLMWRASGR